MRINYPASLRQGQLKHPVLARAGLAEIIDGLESRHEMLMAKWDDPLKDGRVLQMMKLQHAHIMHLMRMSKRSHPHASIFHQRAAVLRDLSLPVAHFAPAFRWHLAFKGICG